MFEELFLWGEYIFVGMSLVVLLLFFGIPWIIILISHFASLLKNHARWIIITFYGMMTWFFAIWAFISAYFDAGALTILQFIIYFIIFLILVHLFWSSSRNWFDKIAGVLWFILFLGIQLFFVSWELFNLLIHNDFHPVYGFSFFLHLTYSIFFNIAIITFLLFLRKDFDKFHAGGVIGRDMEYKYYIWKCPACSKFFPKRIVLTGITCPHCGGVIFKGKTTSSKEEE
jgi:DNA-directed RNA polymerase subunit RPC12/RpoP